MENIMITQSCSLLFKIKIDQSIIPFFRFILFKVMICVTDPESESLILVSRLVIVLFQIHIFKIFNSQCLIQL